MRNKLMRFEWPNGLGFDLVGSDGEWSFFKPDGAKPWAVNFYPPGELQATLHGEGISADAARESATPINYEPAPF